MHVYSGPAVFYQTLPQNFFAVVGDVPQQAGNPIDIKINFSLQLLYLASLFVPN